MRRRALTAALISGAALLSVPTSVAAAAPVPAAPGAVTLITGDRVELSPTGAPRIIPAAGREGVHYRITRDDEHLNVVPLDAMPLLAAGRLDPRLFDVNALVDAGYTADLGLIVRRDPAARAATPALREKRALPAVRAVAAQVSTADTQELWKSLVAGKSGLTEVWLNGRRELTLEHSVPQIGAPAAWQSGYTGMGTTVAVLDSGIDATHPDLAGRVAEAANFTTAPDGDQAGHVVATGGGVAVRTPVAVEKEDERYAVNLTHIDREGDTPAIHLTTFDKVGDGCVGAEECSPYTVGDGPTSTLRLPPGEYIVTDTSSTDGQDTAILTHPKLVVEADVALTLDARATKPVDVRAPRGEAANVRLTMGYDTGIPLLVVAYIFNTGWEMPPLYVGQVPGSPPAGGRVHSLVNAKFGEPGPAGDFTATPYVYNLASAKDGIYDGVRLVPSPREFAKVETTYATPSAAPRGATLDHMATSRTAPDWFFDPPFFLRFLQLSRLPQHVTEYYLADGVRWSTMVEHYNEDYTSPLQQEDSVAGRVYQAGRTYRVDWGKGVLGPAFDEPRLYPLGPQGVGRTGDEFLAGISSASDATHFSGPHLPTGAGRLLRDGQVVAEWPEAGYMVTTLPPAAATYQLEHTARTGVDVSTEISSRWTFRSGHTTSPTPLPLMAVRFTPALDDHNRAAPGRFTIPVSAQRQPGAAASTVDGLAVEVSYDDGTTWRSVPVVGGKVIVDNPAGGAVSLRAKAVDGAGNKVEQTIMRAYLVR